MFGGTPKTIVKADRAKESDSACQARQSAAVGYVPTQSSTGEHSQEEDTCRAFEIHDTPQHSAASKACGQAALADSDSDVVSPPPLRRQAEVEVQTSTSAHSSPSGEGRADQGKMVSARKSKLSLKRKMPSSPQAPSKDLGETLICASGCCAGEEVKTKKARTGDEGHSEESRAVCLINEETLRAEQGQKERLREDERRIHMTEEEDRRVYKRWEQEELLTLCVSRVPPPSGSNIGRGSGSGEGGGGGGERQLGGSLIPSIPRAQPEAMEEAIEETDDDDSVLEVMRAKGGSEKGGGKVIQCIDLLESSQEQETVEEKADATQSERGMEARGRAAEGGSPRRQMLATDATRWDSSWQGGQERVGDEDGWDDEWEDDGAVVEDEPDETELGVRNRGLDSNFKRSVYGARGGEGISRRRRAPLGCLRANTVCLS